MKNIRRKREKLWKENSKCRKCGVVTELPIPEEKIKDNTATLQHIYQKHHPQRNTSGNKVTLWCYRCNISDGYEWAIKLFRDRIVKMTDDELKQEIEFQINKMINRKVHEDVITKYQLAREEINNRRV